MSALKGRRPPGVGSGDAVPEGIGPPGVARGRGAEPGGAPESPAPGLAGGPLRLVRATNVTSLALAAVREATPWAATR
jgi:hypothetical protein